MDRGNIFLNNGREAAVFAQTFERSLGRSHLIAGCFFVRQQFGANPRAQADLGSLGLGVDLVALISRESDPEWDVAPLARRFRFPPTRVAFDTVRHFDLLLEWYHK